ncbi:hypothetical protein [Natrinema salifodinae]|nr:hypothetical protein [Natrinema salifodinae]
MIDLSSAPVLGFLGGIFGGTVAQGWAFLRRRKRHLDRLRSVLKEIRGISKYQLEDADNGHSEMSDDDLRRLEEALKQARLEASYLLSDGQRKKIDKVENQFSYISHGAGDNPTSLDNSQLADNFAEYSQKALDSLKWKTVKAW